MNYYWDGKCFFCIFWGTLIAIVSLSTHSIVKEHKKEKRYEHNTRGRGPLSDSTRRAKY
jgi:predicted ATP-dependent serine protease